jgi:cell division protein ZapA
MTNVDVVTIQLLDRSFQLKCSPEKAAKLQEAGAYLASKMEQLNKANSTLGYERTTIMAAMDICFELINLRADVAAQDAEINQRIKNLQEKVDTVIASTELRLPQSPAGEQQSLDV